MEIEFIYNIYIIYGLAGPTTWAHGSFPFFTQNPNVHRCNGALAEKDLMLSFFFKYIYAARRGGAGSRAA